MVKKIRIKFVQLICDISAMLFAWIPKVPCWVSRNLGCIHGHKSTYNKSHFIRRHGSGNTKKARYRPVLLLIDLVPKKLQKQICFATAKPFKGDSRDPQQWDPLMGSFPYYSHTIPIRIPKDMGMVWEAYHKGGPIVGGP